MDDFIPEKRETKCPVKQGNPSSKDGHLGASPSPACSYDIVFCVDEQEAKLEDDGIMWVPTKWYMINVHADGPGKVYPKPLFPYWKGKVPSLGCLAVLGSHIYGFGGLSHAGSRVLAIHDVYRLRVSPYAAKEFIPISPMLSWRYHPLASVLGNKIYVRNDEFQTPPLHYHWGEVFDPANGKWETLPNPPKYPVKYPECTVISAVLENPERIIVAYRAANDHSSAIFYVYNVQHRSWGLLVPAKRQLHHMCKEDWVGRAASVGNTLYWIERENVLKDDILFIAYDLGLNMWVEGCLKGHGIFFFQDYGILGGEARCPAFLHLEKQRFCLLQCADDDYLRCVVVDVSHTLQEKTLSISVVWDQNYAMEPKICRGLPTVLAYCNIL